MSQNNLAPKRWSPKFSKPNWKKIVWKNLLKSLKYWNCKVLLDIIANTITQLIPCLCYIIDLVSTEIWWSYWWNGPKAYTRRTRDEKICLLVLFFYVLPRHTNIMTEKDFNHYMLPDVYVSSHRKKSTSLLPEGTVKCSYLAA